MDIQEALRALRERNEGLGETIATIGTGMAADVPAGLHGLGTLLMGKGAKRAAENVERTRERFTYKPRTSAGREGLEGVGKGVEAAVEALRKVPGANAAETGWRDFSVAQPALAATLLGVANVADPGKGAGRAARKAARRRSVT